MQKLPCLLVGALLAAASIPGAPVQAATYTFNPTTIINGPKSAPFFPYTPSDFPKVSIAIQDSAVQSGAFSATYNYIQSTYGGDYSSLISFNIGNFISLTPSLGGVSSFRANFLFDPLGNVTAGALFYSSDRFEVDLAGTAALFQGTFVPSDNLDTGFASGTFTAIPEPASLLLLVTAMSLTVRRRR